MSLPCCRLQSQARGISHVLSTVRTMIGQTRDAIGLAKRVPATQADSDTYVSREVATLAAIRLTDMAGLGPSIAES